MCYRTGVNTLQGGKQAETTKFAGSLPHLIYTPERGSGLPYTAQYDVGLGVRLVASGHFDHLSVVLVAYQYLDHVGWE